MTDPISTLLDALMRAPTRIEAHNLVSEFLISQEAEWFSDVIGTEEMARVWGVSQRRAAAHAARLAAGGTALTRKVGNTWIMASADAERYRPGKPGNPNLGNSS